MEFTINSRKLGQEVTFSRPGSFYIFVDLNDRPGTLGLQPCHGGDTNRGATVGYNGENNAVFEKICRAWWGQYLKSIRDFENFHP